MHMFIIISVITYNVIKEISMTNCENAKKNKIILVFMGI